MLVKNWRLCIQLAASACKICLCVALSSIVPANFPNQISKGRQLNSQKHGRGFGLANAKKIYYDGEMACYTPLVCLSLVLWPSVACKIVPMWLPVACKFRPILFTLHATGGHTGTISMRLEAVTQVQFICHWLTLGYNLYATGCQSHAKFAWASGQLRTKPPVFGKHAARTII